MSPEQEKREYVLNAIASYPTQQEAAIALGTCPRVILQWNTNKSLSTYVSYLFPISCPLQIILF
ncbi:hypothetical protein [Nostoc sp.]|uniref:hypothetical protein n=1 Tax=Nostoc sp. TaxID=1180 RepID=UPI002FF72EAC